MSLAVMFIVGCVTWALYCGRSLAWGNRQHGRFAFIVGLDEVIGILVGMWLANHGTYTEGVVCAIGGLTAAYIISRTRK